MTCANWVTYVQGHIESWIEGDAHAGQQDLDRWTVQAEKSTLGTLEGVKQLIWVGRTCCAEAMAT
jgi:hypothetical protein